MRDTLTKIGFTLVIIGTIGLLVNEFVVDWERVATLTLAIMNLAGLITLGYLYYRSGIAN